MIVTFVYNKIILISLIYYLIFQFSIILCASFKKKKSYYDSYHIYHCSQKEGSCKVLQIPCLPLANYGAPNSSQHKPSL